MAWSYPLEELATRIEEITILSNDIEIPYFEFEKQDQALMKATRLQLSLENEVSEVVREYHHLKQQKKSLLQTSTSMEENVVALKNAIS